MAIDDARVSDLSLEQRLGDAMVYVRTVRF